MKVTLFDFQEDALAELHKKLAQARPFASTDNPQAISFSAPTGAGKTIVMTALFEDILFGSSDLEAQPDAVILWLSDMPELNEQTRLKIESKSDRIRVRQLVTVDSTFDAEQLAGGAIYFMNTQKLGTDKLLTRKGDQRQHTIWETFTNTALALPDRFYVVIDEAHRGMRVGKAAERALTIMQRFLLGSDEDGLCRMPLVLGLSATPQRFENLLANAPHTVFKVPVKADDVRESGLLKDRIVINYPAVGGQAEMTLLGEAATRWQTMQKLWKTYCRAEGEPEVRPILVVQVEDGNDNVLTKTNLGATLATLESALGRRLREGEVAHTFNEVGDHEIDGRRVRRIEASRIEDDPKVNVVLFKMSLSTGWDCPRAEVMMSFRRAQDHTYIAQLLGRMVRAPLARRIEKDAALNDVHLYLPHYDRATVDAIVKDLQNVEDVPPTTIGTHRELVTLTRRSGTEAIFEAMRKLVTYRVNAVRKQSHLRRLMGLGRGLTHDRIDEALQTQVTEMIIGKMTDEVARIRASGALEQRAKQITGVALETGVFNGAVMLDERQLYTIEAASADIDRHFQQAGRLLGNGLHMAYWKAQGTRDADEVKVEAIVLAQDNTGMAALEQLAETKFDTLYEQHKWELGSLAEVRRKHYEKLRLATAKPQDILWLLPDSIDFRRSPDAPFFDRHLYIHENGKFQADLGTWEQGVLEEELADPTVVAWLRNIDRKQWSLEIPYNDSGTIRPMFPDLIIVRQVNGGLRFDILEPHDPTRDDNAAKAVGLAEFAEKHPLLFDRIQLIRKQKGPDGKDHYYRLDVGKDAVRKKVLGAGSSNNILDQVFDEVANLR
ncbi:MAG: DEAD/DEAH box helicase family protein [Chloroflexi bacterium]|nr:DEAD/DEAH box helicase family protein [Chloroflexota bacterium]